MAAIGESLKQARERAGMTQGQLAAKLGVDRNTVSRAENDHTSPTGITLVEWARECGVSIDEMLAPLAPAVTS